MSESTISDDHLIELWEAAVIQSGAPSGVDDISTLRCIAVLIAAEEREACAKACLQVIRRDAEYSGSWGGYGDFDGPMSGPECATVIRARGSAALKVQP